MAFLRCLSAELHKYKRSTLLLICIVAPVFVGFAAMRPYIGEPRTAETTRMFMIQYSTNWGLFMVIPLTALIAAMSCALENDSWKMLMAQPVARSWLYLAKLVAINLFIIGMGCILDLLMWLVGTLLGLPGIEPWLSLWGFTGISVLALLPVSALHLWISTRFRHFLVPTSLGILGIIIGLLASSSTTWYYLPWCYVISYQVHGKVHPPDTNYLLVGIAMGLVLTMLGMLDFVHRELTA
ncbi:hypothetical protein EPA93_09750 [Ktedonosporobacter rubrisoli]|uniref:ABC transporter permease n=1 Tax=Ktedonosporobacter rubrisoli TaxID=2509675 RepID=A0A4P6JLY0_KTERU|nr:ABC transporter permease [Ktedonosporobacter rubrisoli]QBD76277.1 hypothetical protein EPA93_09750 [Ktedonosporobacter rubrisoli]